MIEDLKFDIRYWEDDIKERFLNKDLVSLEELLRDYKDLIYEIKELRNPLEELDNE